MSNDCHGSGVDIVVPSDISGIRQQVELVTTSETTAS